MMNKCKLFGHNWDYINSHNRICKRCKKHQNEYSEAFMTTLGIVRMFDYWETISKQD